MGGPYRISRRGLLVVGAGVVLGTALPTKARAGEGSSTAGPYGPLQPPDPLGLRLPEGFEARVVAMTGQPVADTGYPWHLFPDGGACFGADDRGWVYVSNSEVPSRQGGASALRFGPDGEVIGAYRILEGTSMNCAGGPTPWGRWLSCEEFDLHEASQATIDEVGAVAGRVWECDPLGEEPAVERPALGRFAHEAVAVDPVAGVLYLTEDQGDGLLYRFRPDAYPDLDSGVLEAALVEGGRVSWVPVPDPAAGTERPSQQLAGEVTNFAGGEGIWFHDGSIVFTTKGTNQVHLLRDDRLEVLYDPAGVSDPVLTGVDNLTVAPRSGELFVAEDGGNMELVLVDWEGRATPFLRLEGHDGSEVTGPAFSPDGTRLYFSSQRGEGNLGVGVTYEVVGPFTGAGEEPDTAPTTAGSTPGPSTTLAATSTVAGATGGTDSGGSDDGGSGGDGGGTAVPALVAGGAVVVGAGVAATLALRRRGSRADQDVS